MVPSVNDNNPLGTQKTVSPETKHTNSAYHDLLRKMILIYEKHPILHIYTKSFAFIRERNFAKKIFNIFPTKMSSMGFRTKQSKQTVIFSRIL